MSKTSHLYRRGNVLYFRLSVPNRYRAILNISEFTQSLHTQNVKDAIPAAHKLAYEVKSFFLRLDVLMSENPDDVDFRLLEAVSDSLDVYPVDVSKQKGLGFSLKVMMAMKKEKIKTDKLMEEVEERHEQALKQRELDTYRRIHSLVISAPVAQQAPIVEKLKDSKAPLLSDVYEEFLNGHPINRIKLETFRNLFIEGFAGDIKIDQLTQKKVNEFFFLLVKCKGSRTGQTKAYQELNIHERVTLAEKNGDVLMGPSTFKTTYVGAATQFFKWLHLKYADVAPVLTTSHIKYSDFGGLRAKGEDKQRALKISEVERLMTGFVVNKKTEHQFWLMMLGLFTGGRVNEICQMNPQYDVILDTASGIWYFNLTNDEAGAHIKKSHKNEGSKRRVPVHSKLIELGFLGYIERIKALGHDRIFNGFRPQRGRAAHNAEKFFMGHLKDVRLYDNKTIGKKILGMHSLRGSFMSHLVNCLIKVCGLTKKQAMSKIQPLVGHSDGLSDENGADLSITGAYIDGEIVGDLSADLVVLKAVIEVLNYGLEFK